MITIEEAHKFLNPSAAKQTIFGTIAREMRKYYVSLLVVDQRPSGIDDEVLSQIGTRITALLNDEKDIQAVLTGVSGTDGLRSVLAGFGFKAAGIGHRPRGAHARGHKDARIRVAVLPRHGLSRRRSPSRAPRSG